MSISFKTDKDISSFKLIDKDGKVIDKGSCKSGNCEGDFKTDKKVTPITIQVSTGKFYSDLKKIIIVNTAPKEQYVPLSVKFSNFFKKGESVSAKAVPQFTRSGAPRNMPKQQIGVLDLLRSSMSKVSFNVINSAVAADSVVTYTSDMPTSNYKTTISCPIPVRQNGVSQNLTFTVGKDGVMNLDAQFLTNPQLANCTARVEADPQEYDEDEVVSSSFSVDLRTPLLPLINNLPSGKEPTFYINLINGKTPSDLYSNQSVAKGSTVKMAYVLPDGIVQKSFDMQGTGAYSSNAAVNVSCTDKPLICSYDLSLTNEGNFTPKFKATWQGKLITVTAPTITVVDPAKTLPTVTLNVPTTAEVGKAIAISATVNGTLTNSSLWSM